MDRKTSLPLALLGALMVSACAGEAEPAMEDAQAEEPAEMAAATTTAASEFEGCFINERMALDTRPSPLSTVRFSYANGDALLCYGAPSVNGRVIFGDLEAWGQPWRAGANEATAIHLSGPASVGGVALEAGSYSLYAVPGETEWEFFINSNAERWGIPIDDGVMGTNVGSFTVTPEPTMGPVETLRYSFEPNSEGTMGDVVLEWENTRLSFHVHPGEM